MKRKNKNLPKPQTMKLNANHTWTAPNGYKVVVLERGLVSFNVPIKWIIAGMTPFEMHDAAPPDDDARLTVTHIPLPPGVDWSGLPLTKLMQDVTKGSKLKILAQSPVKKVERTDIELVWKEDRFQDPIEPREAFTRIALARGWNVQVVITVDFWVDDLERISPMWDELLRSLQLGQQIQDPLKGPTLH